MARYWVGGTGTWDLATTTNWAASSGGAGGASVPAATDDVFFDANSGTGTCTINASVVCNSLQSSGSTLKTLSHNTGLTVSVGSATAGASNIALDFSGLTTYTLGNAATSAITFVSTSATVQTVNFNGLTTGNVTYNSAVSGSWQLTGIHNMGSAATITLTQGTLDVNGQTCSWGVFFSSNTNTRTLTLGAANITLTGGSTCWNFGATTGLTFNAGTSTITIASGSPTFAGGSQTYSNVIWNAGSGANLNITRCTNLTVNGGSDKRAAVQLPNTTITGTVTVTGASAVNRVLIYTTNTGTQSTITAAAVSFQNVDFMDIRGAGAANWSLAGIPGGSGDCGGNASITFTTAAPQTWSGTTGGNWSANAWTSRVPLPQDNVSIPAAFAAGQTITADMPRLGKSVDWTGATGSPTWNFGTTTTTTIFGSLTLVSGVSISGTQSLTFGGRGSFTVTPAGAVFTNALAFNAPTGTYTLGGALSTQGGLTANSSLTTSSNNISCTTLTMGGNVTRTLNFGSSVVTLTSTAAGNIVNVSSVTGVTFLGSSATFIIADASANTRTFVGGGLSFGTLTYTVASSVGELDITGSNTFNTLNFYDTASQTTRTLRFTAGTTTTITGAFNVHGVWGNLISIASTSATPATLTANIGTINCKYIQPSNTTVTGTSTWSAINATDGGGNTGWTFSVVPVVQVYINSLSAWKAVNNVQIQIGGAWKTINKIQVSIGGVWKQVS